MKVECPYCFKGRVIDTSDPVVAEAWERNNDRMPSGAQAAEETFRTYPQAAERCGSCNGTGKVER